MATVIAERDFFITGGTLPAGASSYVERAADRALFDHLIAGRFCYVFNARQMGKSSLCVRTMQRLDGAGVRCAFVDLTKIGGRNATAEQWYAGIAFEIGRTLGLRREFLAYWKEHEQVTPMQRMFGALRDVALEKSGAPLAVLFDEIDATRSLPFSADEFFAAIRESYNRRVQDPVYERLTFCLLGVAVPSDLITSPTSTPFNIGERVYLRDFSLEEAVVLAQGFQVGVTDAEARALVERVFYWTNGHPYLTQSLCAAIVSERIMTRQGVDDLVCRDLFDPQAKETNINLADVANRALRAGDAEPDPEKFRADLLSLYERALRGRPIPDDEANRAIALLKLSGMMRSDGRRLFVRNRIYERVFNRTWVQDNMPGQELRRLRRAYWQGVVRTTLVGALVILIVSALAIRSEGLRREASRLKEEIQVQKQVADARAYSSTMRDVGTVWARHNVSKVRQMLADVQKYPYRGWEWEYWSHLANQDRFDLETGATMFRPAVSADGRWVWFAGQGYMHRFDTVTGQVDRLYPSAPSMMLVLLPDGYRAIELPSLGSLPCLRDLRSGRRTPLEGAMDVPLPVRGGATLIGLIQGRIATWDVATGKPTILPSDALFTRVCPETDGKHVLASKIVNDETALVELTYPGLQQTAAFVGCPSGAFAASPDGRCLYAEDASGHIQLWEIGSRKRIWKGGDLEMLDPPEFSPDGKWLVCITLDRQAKLLRIAGKDTQFERSIPEAQWAQLSADGRSLITVYDSGFGASIRVTDWVNYHESFALPSMRELECRALPNGDEICAILEDRLVYLNPLTGAVRRRVQLPGAFIRSNQMGSRRDRLMALVTDKGACIADGDTGRVVLPGLPAEYAVDAVTSVGDHECLIARHARPILELWDFRTRRRVRTIPVESWATALAASPDGKTIAAGLVDGPIELFDTTDFGMRELGRDAWNPLTLRFSSDSRHLFAGMNDDYAIMFDLKSGSSLLTKTHDQVVWDLDLSPDGRRIATASDDHTVRVWDAVSGAELTVLTGHTGRVSYVRWTSDGKSIVSEGADGFRTWSER